MYHITAEHLVLSQFLTLYRELINLDEPVSKSSIDRQTHFASKYVAESRSTLCVGSSYLIYNMTLLSKILVISIAS